MIYSNQAFELIQPKVKKVPFILSIPHCGVSFPTELKNDFVPHLINAPDDTDWFLEHLYDFAQEMGITVIKAVYSRWVIDLNRSPENQSLYKDGRMITSLCPTTTFFGEKLYKIEALQPNKEEVERRLEKYYWPYHDKIDELLESRKADFGKVLFWDAHSIRRNVDTIQKEDFPDLILGNDDLKTSNSTFIEEAIKTLGSDSFDLKHNKPFKGGFITRSKGNPQANIHALQLEMCKDLYMSNNETIYDPKKAKRIKNLLKSTFENLISHLND
tara:strand:- start:3747 stop:4562 length:816 start_codon:yes stop_codon:yes gene_type:complete